MPIRRQNRKAENFLTPDETLMQQYIHQFTTCETINQLGDSYTQDKCKTSQFIARGGNFGIFSPLCILPV